MEAKTGSSDHGPRLFRAPLGYGEASGARSARQGIENNGGIGNLDTAKANGASTSAEKLIGYSSIGSLTMPEAGADSLLIWLYRNDRSSIDVTRANIISSISRSQPPWRKIFQKPYPISPRPLCRKPRGFDSLSR